MSLTDMSDPKRLTVSATEFGRIFGMGKEKVGDLIRGGHIKGKKVGRRWMIPKSEMERIMSELEELPSSKLEDMPTFGG